MTRRSDALAGAMASSYEPMRRTLVVSSLLTSSCGPNYPLGQVRGVSPDGRRVVTGAVQNATLWDLVEGRWVTTFRLGEIPSAMTFSPDGKWLAAAIHGKPIEPFDAATGELKRSLPGNKDDVLSLAFSPDGKTLASGADGHAENMTLRLWDVASGKELHDFSHFTGVTYSLSFTADGKELFAGVGAVKRFEVATGRPLGEVWGASHSNSLQFSPDGRSFLTLLLDKVLVTDLGTGRYSAQLKSRQGHFARACFTRDGKQIITGGEDGEVRIFDLDTEKEVKTLSGHSGPITGLVLLPDGKRLVSSGHDGSMRVWNLSTGEWVAFVAGAKPGRWITFTPDGYWDGSTDSGDLVSAVVDGHAWNVDQLGALTNRPDLVLARLGSSDAELAKGLLRQHERRLAKLHLGADGAGREISVPTATLQSATRAGKAATVSVSFDDDVGLERYSVWVNDVPLFGAQGKALRGKSAKITEKFELTRGTDKIEVGCTNTRGLESFRVATTFEVTEPAKPDLYYLGFGVSKYARPELELSYAHKDALDLAKALEKTSGKKFGKVIAKTWIDDQVTPANIASAKALLKAAKPEDVLVLFIAGHGTHDQDGTYYYLTSNSDPKNLAATAVTYEAVEDLLQGVPPRKKLFLMDACESGELDEGEALVVAEAKSKGLESRGIKKRPTDAPPTGSRPKPRSRDRFIDNDLSRRSGAIVISSSRGGELSYERADVANGLFTRALVEALTTPKADANEDEEVTVEELLTFVKKEVVAASGGLQTPTIDRDNIYQKFGLASGTAASTIRAVATGVNRQLHGVRFADDRVGWMFGEGGVAVGTSGTALQLE